MKKPEVLKVNVPLADLRREPVERASSITERDCFQETQCLYGETLLIQEDKGEWVQVLAPEQSKINSLGNWEGYPGWIQKKQVCENVKGNASNLVVKVPWARVKNQDDIYLDLPLGTRLHSVDSAGNKWVIDLANEGRGLVEKKDVYHISDLVRQNEEERRAAVIEMARYSLGAPYFWGGRGVYSDSAEITSSIDCSGLVNLAYHSCGISVPRNAHDQFLWSKRIAPENLKIGDLLFLSECQQPGYVSHVMIYSGEGLMIEATGESNDVREISIEKRLGAPLEKMSRACQIGKYNIFFGSFLMT